MNADQIKVQTIFHSKTVLFKLSSWKKKIFSYPKGIISILLLICIANYTVRVIPIPEMRLYSWCTSNFKLLLRAPSSVLSWVYPHNQVVISDGPSNSLVMDETRQSSVSFSWCASRMELALAKLNIWSDGTYVTTGFFWPSVGIVSMGLCLKDPTMVLIIWFGGTVTRERSYGWIACEQKMGQRPFIEVTSWHLW